MKTDLKFEFTVDRENYTLTLKREFKGPLALVWKAWTKPELLDRWWGPEPWRAETVKMNFEEGGHWLYAMVGPAGERHYGRADYLKIVKENYYEQNDGFCDENGVFNPELPKNFARNSFRQLDKTKQSEHTEVEMYATFDSLEDLDMNLEMGFKEGITQCFIQLDALLEKLF